MNEKSNFPDFIIVGAAKSGTTALHKYLDKHPDVFLPVEKELYFWQVRKNPNQAIIRHFEGRRNIPQTLVDYLVHYDDAKPGQKKGEATPSYLYYYDCTIQSLRELHPNFDQIKIIIILRDPVDRILSEFRFVKKLGLDPDDLSLEESLEAEVGRKRENLLLPDLFYTDVSRYAEQVAAYKKNFSAVEVILYDELKEDSQSLCERLCNFIGVDPRKLPSVGNDVHNHSKTRKEARGIAKPIARFVGPLWKAIPACKLKARIREMAFVERPIEIGKVRPDVMKQLYERFLPEIDELERVTGLDLSEWKTRYKSAIRDLS